MVESQAIYIPIQNRIADAIAEANRLKAPWKFAPNNQWFQEIGISKHKFSKFLENDLQPDLSELQKLALAIGCEVSDLYVVKSKKTA